MKLSNMLHEEGLNNVFKRHARYSKATRIAVECVGFRSLLPK